MQTKTEKKNVNKTTKKNEKNVSKEIQVSPPENTEILVSPILASEPVKRAKGERFKSENVGITSETVGLEMRFKPHPSIIATQTKTLNEYTISGEVHGETFKPITLKGVGKIEKIAFCLFHKVEPNLESAKQISYKCGSNFGYGYKWEIPVSINEKNEVQYSSLQKLWNNSLQ